MRLLFICKDVSDTDDMGVGIISVDNAGNNYPVIIIPYHIQLSKTILFDDWNFVMQQWQQYAPGTRHSALKSQLTDAGHSEDTLWVYSRDK